MPHIEKTVSTTDVKHETNDDGEDSDDAIAAATAAALIVEEWPTKCISYVSKIEVFFLNLCLKENY